MKLSRKSDPLKKKLKLKIEKDIKIPKPAFGRKAYYPIKTMEIGDSFFVPAKDHKKVESVRSTVNSSARRNMVRISVRKVTENGVAGIRVWRVE